VHATKRLLSVVVVVVVIVVIFYKTKGFCVVVFRYPYAGQKSRIHKKNLSMLYARERGSPLHVLVDNAHLQLSYCKKTINLRTTLKKTFSCNLYAATGFYTQSRRTV